MSGKQVFAIVYEAEADLKVASELADRVLVESIDWLEESHLESCRTWVSRLVGGEPLKWTRIKQLARDTGIKVAGHMDHQAAYPDAKAARRAILYLEKIVDDVAGIVLIRDQDDQPERRKGLEQARQEHQGKTPVVIGLAVVEREAWVISGFEPRNADEQSRLSQESQTLGFQPQERSQELTACKDDNSKRSPKRVLQALTGGNFERERSCWNSTALELLRERGAENGLKPYLEEVREHLAPRIGHIAGRAE